MKKTFLTDVALNVRKGQQRNGFIIFNTNEVQCPTAASCGVKLLSNLVAVKTKKLA